MSVATNLKSLGLSRKVTQRGTVSQRRTLRLESLESRWVPANLTVGTGQTYATIQAALSAATAGSTIQVYGTGSTPTSPGLYSITSSLLITQKNLTLQVGDGNADADDPSVVTIQAAPTFSGSMINVTGGGDVIKGFTIDGGGNKSLAIDSAISVTAGGSVSIKNNTIQNLFNANIATNSDRLGTAIRVGDAQGGLGSGVAKITNNVIQSYHKAGVIVDGSGSAATITGNTITGAGSTSIVIQYGIDVKNAASARIDSNFITANINAGGFEAGGIIIASTTAKTAITNNTISGNQSGVFLDGSDVPAGLTANIGVQNVQIFNNDVKNNTDVGVLLESGNTTSTEVTQNLIGHNSITGNTNGGILMFDAVSNQIIDNNVSNNPGDGLFIDNSNVGTTASNNNIQDNDFDSNALNGIALNNSSGNTLINNGEANNGANGILITGGTNNLVLATNSSLNINDGIQVSGANNTTIDLSVFVANGGYAINVQGCSNTTINFNAAIANGAGGINVVNSTNTQEFGNVVFASFNSLRTVRGQANVSSDDTNSTCNADALTSCLG
jgi:parallel beta-helix repeat protein